MKTLSHSFLRVGTLFLVALFGLLVGIFQAGVGVWAQESGIDDGETAQTTPKIRERTVTATVPDNFAPSAPVLISPENNSKHRTSPSFSWLLAGDNVDTTGYRLTLDGSVLFANIPVVATETTQFSLGYVGATQSYTLTPKTNIADGTHTWKITAFDARGNETDSTTWTFSLDTLAPSFTITAVDTLTTAISAQDTTTIPEQPLGLINNEPVISGTGEALSTVQLTIQWGETKAERSFSISSAGTWETTLPILPRDTTILLSFLITDQVGNISILEKVPLILPSETLTLPGTGGTTISLPTNPRELLFAIGGSLAQLLPRDLRENAPLPAPIATITKVTKQVTQPVATLLFVSVVPVIAVVSLVAPLGAGVSASAVHHALYALGYLPNRKKQGIIIDATDQAPIPLARVTLVGETETGRSIHTTVFSNIEGVYQPFNPEYGTYRVLVEKRHFSFPMLGKRPRHLAIETLYQGEVFTIDRSHPEPSLVIPLERISTNKATETKSLGYQAARLAQYKNSFGALSWLFMAGITTLQPSYINLLTFGSFTSILALRKVFSKQHLRGVVINTHNQAIQHVVVRSIDRDSGALQDITQSKKGGIFYLEHDHTRSALEVIDMGRSWSAEEQAKTSEQLSLGERKSCQVVLSDVLPT